MSPSWGRISVASSRSGLTFCSVVLIQILQPWGSAAEWEGPAKMGMATFVSHACHSLNSALFHGSRRTSQSATSGSYLRNALLVSYSSGDTFRVGWAETSLTIGKVFCLVRYKWIFTLSMPKATSNIKHQTATNKIFGTLLKVFVFFFPLQIVRGHQMCLLGMAWEEHMGKFWKPLMFNCLRPRKEL